MPLFKRVDQLPAATGVTGSDFLILSRPSGPTGTVGTRAVTLSQILALATGGGGSVGGTGPTGAPGAASTVTGPTGVAGSQGPAGAASTVPGPTGPSGPPGADGSAGSNGSPGAQGNTGPTGQPGQAGSNGSPGAQGDTGATGPVYAPSVTGVLLSGTGTYNPLTLDGSFDIYYLTLATGAAIQCLNITGPTGTTKQFLNIGSTGTATLNHATGVNANARVSNVTQGNFLLPILGGVAVVQYDGNQWRVF